MQVSAAVYTGKGVDKNALIEENYRCAFICWRNGILCCCTYARSAIEQFTLTIFLF